MTNQERLADIAKRARRASAGPWTATIHGGIRRGGQHLFDPGKDRFGSGEADAEFVAAARLDVPWLVARVQQLEAALLRPGPGRKVLAEDPLEHFDVDPTFGDMP